MSFADLDVVVGRAMESWRPPPRLSLSEWADRYFVLSTESAAEPGRWRTLPYQREILDSITDPEVVQVTVMKSARVGYTLCMSCALGYHIHQDPASVLVVQPTVDDAKEFSKETVAPMLRDVPVLAAIRVKDVIEKGEKGPKDASNTLTHKAYPGGVLSLTGANSGTGLRRKSRRIVLLDEVDAYPASAGSEGDPVSLAKKRSEHFWNRKIVAGSTPLVAGVSRIAEMYEAGDGRRYHVPCPQCGHMDFLTFREGERGHWMRWPERKPAEAHFVCRGNGCVIEHRDKRVMVERGKWIPQRPEVVGHRSFHLWAAYSYSPNATWAQIATEFLEAKAGGAEKLRTFVNTTLGETWQETGEAPEWERLYRRRELYGVGTVPDGVRFLTAGVDVQKDRLVWEVVGWAEDRQSWSIDAGVIPGDTSSETPWAALDELLAHAWRRDGGPEFHILSLAIDSGYNTNVVYNWARGHPMSRVIACKGVATAKVLLGSPSPVDVTVRGKRFARGYKVWPIGVDVAKAELYGWLRLEPPTKAEDAYPPGFCHFPEHGEDYFRQITAEHLVRTRNRRGFTVLEWQLLPNRENHYLDCRVYARAAAALAGLDRMGGRRAAPSAATPAAAPPPAPAESEAPAATPRGGWLRGGSGGMVGGRGGWLSRRR